MKKLLILLLMLALAISATAIADEDTCYHTNTSEFMAGLVYNEWSSTNHQVLYEIVTHCEDCYAILDIVGEGYFEPHAIGVNECVFCGYSLSNTPSPEDLQREALLRITENADDIIGKTAIVIHNGNVRAEANTYSSDLGAVITDDEYEIVSYIVTDDSSVWLEVKYGTGTAWISASLAQISGANVPDADYAEFYIGRTCTIKVSSGRARIAADKDSPVIEYVRYGERYTILACQTAPDGTLWFQIKVNNSDCWISSGLTNTN